METVLLQDESSPLIASDPVSYSGDDLIPQQQLKRDDGDGNTNAGESTKGWKHLSSLYSSQSFLFNVLAVIILAYLYPPLGAVYVMYEVIAGWVLVVLIFLLSGLGLETAELNKSFQQLNFNLFVHFFNFGIVSFIVYCVSDLMVRLDAISSDLGEGWVICSCLPLTINMIIVFTKSVGGNEAAAVFNAALGSFLGVFISPALILLYMGVKQSVNLGHLFWKLILAVILPILVGQSLRKHSEAVAAFVRNYRMYFKSVQEYALVFTVYTVFCKTFLEGSIASPREIFLMVLLEFTMICFVMTLAWFSLGWLFSVPSDLRVMGLFGCTLKSIAFGVPLINTMYRSSPSIGLYTLPLLIWHSTQLIICVAIIPSLVHYIDLERRKEVENPSGEV